MLRLGWFSTARGKGSQALLRAVQEAIEKGRLDARIEFVFISRDPGEAAETDNFISQVEGYGIPLVTHSYKKFKSLRGSHANHQDGQLAQWRLEYDREVMQKLQGFSADLCVLAGYMLIVGPEMCTRYKMINLHPAAPDGPAGTWMEVIWQLIDRRATETGAMMHLVTPELDEGPVVSYCKFSISGEPFDKYWQEIGDKTSAQLKDEEGEENALFKQIRCYGQVRELPLIIATIRAFASGLIRIEKNRPVDAGGKPVDGHDLSSEIDAEVAGEL
jgi:folate-dependent phosphoribosylglycinamide formyltransferase PurN